MNLFQHRNYRSVVQSFLTKQVRPVATIFISLSLAITLGCAPSKGTRLQDTASENQHSTALKKAETHYRENNYEDAFAVLEPLARQGNKRAKYLLDFRHNYGYRGTIIRDHAKVRRFDDSTQIAVKPVKPESAKLATLATSNTAISESESLEKPPIYESSANSGSADTAMVQTAVSQQKKIEAGQSQTKNPKLSGTRWVLDQQPHRYTIQLITLSREEAINNYIQKYGLQKDTVYFPQNHGGKTVYSLVYGVYPNAEEAKAQQSKLHKELIQETPWVRTIGGIQKLLAHQPNT